MASEAGSFIDDESPELLTLQVASRALFLVKTTSKCRLFFSFFVDLFLSIEVEKENLIN
jgi:hypothetical protein